MTATPSEKPLDDVMLAMDVVDTLRRSNRLVTRELNADGQDRQLLNRLKEIYGTQGIDVPDHILREGVAALREDRFTYTPAPSSFSRKLAKIYISRHQWGKRVLGVLVALVLCALAWNAAFIWPKGYVQRQTQTALTKTLPTAFEALHARIQALTNDRTIKQRAAQLRADGFAYIQSKDVKNARAKRDALDAMAKTLALEYDLRIVNRSDQRSGVWRIPDNNPQARNYYIIVEPVTPDGAVLSVDVMNEENNRQVKTSKFGVRVPKNIFEQVAQDKRDDGIIQKNIIGTKQRGTLEPQYNSPVLNGIITKW